jgi:glycosyltransferase involved in cell wall biosynthesis
MSEPTVSVGIRGWRRDTLPDAIESVLTQGRDDLEVIVGDDAGDLEEIVARYDDPRVRYVRNPTRLGLTANARALFNAASGRYLKLLDDDDRLLPGYLDAVIACLDEDPSLGIAFTNWFHEAGGQLHSRQWPLAGGRHDDFLRTILGGCPVTSSTALMRREAWEDGERRHPLRDDASVDMAVWMRAADAGWPFYFVDSRLVVHGIHPDQISHDEDLIRERAVQVWAGFRFDDPECERLRLQRVAEALLDRGNLRLRRRRLRGAFRDLRAARRIAPGRMGERGLVALLGARHGAARILARHPQLMRPAFAAWRLLRRVDRFPTGARLNGPRERTMG